VHDTAAIVTIPFFVRGPKAIMDRVANTVGAIPDPFGLGLYFVDCENRTKLPAVKFSVGQRYISITQEDYILG
ncbi:hypothetical protein AAVH_12882, partial [Aphelenchoides avenae]